MIDVRMGVDEHYRFAFPVAEKPFQLFLLGIVGACGIDDNAITILRFENVVVYAKTIEDKSV